MQDRRQSSRRRFLASVAGVMAASRLPWSPLFTDAIAARPVPSPSQLEWQRDEFALFLHFGVNTFTDSEWGDGTESPSIFNPTSLDARSWARAAKEGGAKAMVLTAKHHDGFCLWPTKTTEHSVAKSPWRGGRGDVVREFVDACKAEGLKAGLYLSPWDRHEPRYGDSPKYNQFYCDQLTELLTKYGPIHEVWFDGAPGARDPKGVGANGQRQKYDWPRFWELVRKLQPKAVMFSDAGPDIRWIGNENGTAGDPNWSTVDRNVVRFPGDEGPGVMKMLQNGDPAGTSWRPGECDVSIRPGWFHHPKDDGRVKTVDQLVNLYFMSVGRNSKLLLNVPPTRDGRLHETDIARLAVMRERLNTMFARDLAARRPTNWKQTSETSAVLEVDLGQPTNVSIADIREDITLGQRVAQYTLEGLTVDAWVPLSRGRTIGHRKLDRFSESRVRAVRLTLTETIDAPRQVKLGLY
jgi:alpha-L-fucosidase